MLERTENILRLLTSISQENRSLGRAWLSGVEKEVLEELWAVYTSPESITFEDYFATNQSIIEALNAKKQKKKVLRL